MDFLKDNLFYVILIAAIIVVSIPSYILGSQRRQEIRRAQQEAETQIRHYRTRAAGVERVDDAALEAARQHRQQFEAEKDAIIDLMARSWRHMDYEFLVEPAAPGELPDAERYKEAYYDAYARLNQRMRDAGLVTTRESPLPQMEDWGPRRPSERAIRVTQKKYWILNALVDVFTDREAGVVSVQRVLLDHVPNEPDTYNRPTADGRFWLYPLRIEFIIDFRHFPVFLEKLINREDVFFEPPGHWKMARAFDESQAVYSPQVSVSFDCRVWDYIQTDFEQANLAAHRR